MADNDGRDQSPAEIFRLRRQAGLQAWYEYMPVRAAMLPRNGIITDMYREARFGDLLAIDFLDTRSFRTDQPCGDGFKPYCPGIGDAKAQVLSPEEESWLTRNLTRGQAKWNCLAQQVMMMALDRRNSADAAGPIYNMDTWAGYKVQRQRLLGRMNAGQKVASFLLELTDRLGKAGAGGETLVILPLSRQQMADVLGLTIETVSRQLSRLRSAGLIDTPSRREIVLRDRRELEELAG